MSDIWHYFFMDLHITHLEHGEDISPALEIRRQVFQREQGIATESDFDGLDNEAEQFVAYDGETAVGTGRYRILKDGVGKVERVAVIEEYRGRKAGRAIMEAIAQTAKEQGIVILTLDAQQSASSFYESLGYRIEGEVFEEVDKPHVVMALDLRNTVIRNS
jgi:predicted GNAT family N-acyltransferase